MACEQEGNASLWIAVEMSGMQVLKEERELNCFTWNIPDQQA
jgi:hypothetical protein